MTETKAPKTNGSLIRPNAELQGRIDEYHEAFENVHGVRVKRAEILLSLVRIGLDAKGGTVE